MSHSTLLVIVNDAKNENDAVAKAEEKLEPFYEGLEVDPYARDAVSYLDFKKVFYDEGAFPEEEMLHRFNNPTSEDARILEDELYEQDIRIIDGQFVPFSTYNPQSRWDWYKLGGRWSGLLPRKGSAEGVDVIQKKDMDIEGGKARAIADANATYDRFEELKAGRNPGASYEDIVESLDPTIPDSEKYQAARTIYNSNPVVKDASKEFGLFFTSVHNYFKIGKGGRYAFVDDASTGFIETHAVLTDSGDWLEIGQMLMFAVTADPMDESEWSRIFWEQINDTSDDAWFLVYDLHI
jgi:hypothetical protein